MADENEEINLSFQDKLIIYAKWDDTNKKKIQELEDMIDQQKGDVSRGVQLVNEQKLDYETMLESKHRVHAELATSRKQASGLDRELTVLKHETNREIAILDKDIRFLKLKIATNAAKMTEALENLKNENVALRDAVVVYPLEHPSRTVLLEAREFHRHAFEDFVEYGRLRSIYNGRDEPNTDTYEMPYDIFIHYFTGLPPHNSPLSEWAEQKHIIEQKKEMKELPDE